MSCGLRVDALLGVWTIRGKFMGEPRDASTLLMEDHGIREAERGRLLDDLLGGGAHEGDCLELGPRLEADDERRASGDEGRCDRQEPAARAEIRSRDAEVIRRKLALAGIALEVETSASGGAA